MVGIHDLPAELIASIATHLDRVEISNIRLASRDLENGCFELFAKRYFRKKGYMVTSESLDVLYQVSQHEELRRHVHHVWFNPDCFTFLRPRYVPEREDESSEDDSYPFRTPSTISDDLGQQLRSRAYEDCMRDYEHLLYTPRLEQQLSTAFSCLPNLMTVGMRRSEDHSPWGWWRVTDAVGIDPRPLGPIPTGPRADLSGPTHLFIALIKSLATSGVRLRRLYTDAIEIDNVHPSVLTQHELQHACESIWYLEINATKGLISSRDQESCAVELHPEQFGQGLAKFLAAMPSLRELGMMIFPDRKQSHLIPPIPSLPSSWRDSYPFLVLNKLSRTLCFEHLRRVKLEKITTTTSRLIKILKPSSPVLMSIKLRDIRLLSDPGVDDGKSWQPFFHFLSDLCPDLEYVLLHHLAHERGGIRFVEHPVPSARHDGNFIPLATVSRAGEFTDYGNVTIELLGTDDIRRRLLQLIDQHWYGQNIFTYAMDDEIWHTDTSDEDW